MWCFAVQVTAIFAHADQQPYQHSQAAAVDEDHITEVEHDVCAILHEPVDMGVQQLRLTPSDNAPVAPDNGDIAHSPGFQRQPHCASLPESRTQNGTLYSSWHF